MSEMNLIQPLPFSSSPLLPNLPLSLSLLCRNKYLYYHYKSDNMKKLVVLTGAGMSSESGIRTFRDSGGLWEEYDVREVATFDAWMRNRDLVLRFYNERRRQLEACSPNAGHTGLAELEKQFDVQIITQNIDNLHERAGSTKVLHLHGELTKARSTADPALVYEIGYRDILDGDKCEKGSQLRPHIVWFGEEVPMMEEAARLASRADIFVVIGSSLNVYPAAGLVNYAPDNAGLWLIDPNDVDVPVYRQVEVIKEKASRGVEILTGKLLDL
jgi:NAD-dependent deacetylase